MVRIQTQSRHYSTMSNAPFMRTAAAVLVLVLLSQQPQTAAAATKKSITERLQWSLQLPNVEENGAPAKHNGIVTSSDGSMLYMTTQKGFLYGVNARNGTLAMKHEPFPWVKTTESKPVLCEKVDSEGNSYVEYIVYAISDGRVIAVNADTGLERWMMYSEYCTPTQPTMDADCQHVYYTCNKRHINESELFVVNDEESTKAFMGMPSDQVTRQGEKLGPVSLGRRGATRSVGALSVYFGSFTDVDGEEKEDEDGVTMAPETLARAALDSNSGGKTLRYDAMSRSVEELAKVEDGVKSPVGLSNDENYMWARTFDPDSRETVLHGMRTASQADSTVRSGAPSSSTWQRSLGVTAQELTHAPITTHNDAALYIATEKAVYKVATEDGSVHWNVSDLNLKAAPVMHPGTTTTGTDTNGRKLVQTQPSNTLYVMEDTGGRIWKVNTDTGDMQMELNCIESATCAMASHADFATSPDGSMLYIALKSGIVYAVETTEPFDVSTSDGDGFFPDPPTGDGDPSDQNTGDGDLSDQDPSDQDPSDQDPGSAAWLCSFSSIWSIVTATSLVIVTMSMFSL
jgi:outer membrane protein assembly factor BamB